MADFVNSGISNINNSQVDNSLNATTPQNVPMNTAQSSVQNMANVDLKQGVSSSGVGQAINSPANKSGASGASEDTISIPEDNNIPADLDRNVPQKEELYGTEALLANAGIDKQGHMQIDDDAVLDLSSPDLRVIKTLPNGKKVIMSVEEYNKQKYHLTDKDLKMFQEDDVKTNLHTSPKDDSNSVTQKHAEDLDTGNQSEKMWSSGSTNVGRPPTELKPYNISSTNTRNNSMFDVPSATFKDKGDDKNITSKSDYESQDFSNNIARNNMNTFSRNNASNYPANNNLDAINSREDYADVSIPGIEPDGDPDNVPKAQPTKILDPSLAKYKILLIEDNSDVRYQYEFMLKREGFTVITARDGEEGIAKAIKERPQLVLVDILMPNVDGWEVLKALRQYTSTYKPRIMIVSNLGSPEDIEKAYKLGADMFVIKADTTLQQMIEKVKTILKATDSNNNHPLIVPLSKTPELTAFFKQNLPELVNWVCPECGGPLGLKLIPQKHEDSITHKVTLDFNARIVCLRCGKEWV